MKKSIIGVLVLITVVVLQACNKTPKNVYTFIIDESFTEFITMGTSADYPPYEYPKRVDGKNTLVGIDIEIAKEIAKKQGKNLKVVNKIFDYLLADLESGKVDFVMAGMNPTEERALIVDFSKIYYEANHAIVVHKDNSVKYDSLEKINNKSTKVGAQLGSVQQDLAEEFLALATKQYVQAVTDLMMQLNDKSVMVGIVENPVALSFVSKYPNLKIQDIKIGNPEEGSAVAVAKGNKELLDSINGLIDELISSGKINEIVANAIAENN
ncbi:transporter substrate-binding domain-containing protein [Haploplasma axanthum]|uniref:Arginine-binding extracellular protein ArtP n=1 Tax=Haploplasma axanthum TaxID=29552 RepID=A0A449BDE8_HAPAX|nr:transporter substrate-binding domain-containing protein [Haploplasma axanthum]VEU80452.1 Arginine-binding extracellular protein ArtP precursor [Haploplasma axanthum]